MAKQDFTLNMFSKEKRNKLIQTKKNKIKEESYLNFTTIIKYAFCLLTFYFSSGKLNKHTKKCVYFAYNVFVCYNCSTKQVWVFIRYSILLIQHYFLQCLP